ncbi:MAG: TPM domain-containing protein [Cyclobacteriaceae bacterium]|nr:TPM domain-containing protein [Cyclobacteriaceae bacterium]
MRKFFLVLCLVAESVFAQQTYTVESVPNVKVAENRLVSDPEKILNEATVARLDRQLAELESATTSQVAVVVLPSIGTQDIFQFAQELFVHWGIGQASNDNGLLILLVMDQRTVRFHTGHGLEGMLPDVVCKRIQEQYMVPLFREGKNDEALIAGVEEVVRILTDPVYAVEIRGQAEGPPLWDLVYPMVLSVGGLVLLIVFLIRRRHFSDSPKALSTPYSEMRLSRLQWLLEFGGLPALILVGLDNSGMDSPWLPAGVGLYGYFLLTLLHKRLRMRTVVDRLVEQKKFKRTVEFFEEYRTGWLVSAIFFPLPFLIHYPMYLRRMTFYRNHPRDCEKCGKPVRKLDERADDAYLTKAKVFEEGLKSVDYDVWLCDHCGTYFELMYPNRSSKYTHCPKCKTKAWYLKSNRTLVSPTTSSSGTGEKVHECKFCGHQVVSRYTIAQLSDSSSSGGGGSSGGSFGGGSSGGGGASSSW